MRCSTAIVLSTLAIGQAAAGAIRHAGFHARRAAEQKRGYENINWEQAVKDVNWSSVFGKPAATPTPQGGSKAETPNGQVTKPAQPAYTPAPSSAAPKPSGQPGNNNNNNQKGGDVLDKVGDLAKSVLDDVSSVLDAAGFKKAGGQSDECWVGEDSKYKATFSNNKQEDLVVVCWNKMGAGTEYGGMVLAKTAQDNPAPALSIKIPPGKSQVVSFKEGLAGACAPVYKGVTMSNFGGISNTWLEFNWKKGTEFGTFNVSRNVKMSGGSISAKGTQCTSDMNQCYFGCKDGMDSCEAGKHYDLFGRGQAKCHGGYDKKMQGTGGGCLMGDDGEHIKVSFS